MSTLEERLREEMGRSVAAVRPAPDPYARLLRRRRRRGWRWGGAGVVAAVVAGLLGAQTLALTNGPSPAPNPQPTLTGQRAPLNQWTRKILAGPVRGEAAADPATLKALESALEQGRGFWQIGPELDRAKVLFIADIDGERNFGAAYYNDTELVYLYSAAPLGTSATDLVEARYGGQTGGLDPFTVFGKMGRYSISLAPPGCTVESAATSTVRGDGVLEHTWTGVGDFAVLPAAVRLWRVTCDGIVRHVELTDMVGGGRQADVPAAERGSADPASAREAVASCPTLPGLDVRSWRVLWGGTPPGDDRPVVVALGMLDGGAAQVCAVTGTGQSMLVDTAHGVETPANSPQSPPARMTTAAAPSDALVTVRLPARDRVELSDRMLVIAPPGATELRVTGGRATRVPLTGGVGVIEAPVPAVLSIQAVDAGGKTLATAQPAEAQDVERSVAGQALVNRWE
ncbi:hypothetical protein [Dactylosporangium sp. CA-233914]|uniref:hypothetical protein n=1 Tax=Dactylosporangium sp. CA-233914 TaxID=3239934 RepID=UPI003D8EA51A